MPKVCPLVFVALKKPKVMCFDYKSTLKNWITNTKILFPPFDIHKLKLATT
jgi:hypothetical protein